MRRSIKGIVHSAYTICQKCELVPDKRFHNYAWCINCARSNHEEYVYALEHFGEQLDYNDPQGGKSLGSSCQLDNPQTQHSKGGIQQGSQSSRINTRNDDPIRSPDHDHERQIRSKKSVEYFVRNIRKVFAKEFPDWQNNEVIETTELYAQCPQLIGRYLPSSKSIHISIAELRRFVQVWGSATDEYDCSHLHTGNHIKHALLYIIGEMHYIGDISKLLCNLAYESRKMSYAVLYDDVVKSAYHGYVSPPVIIAKDGAPYDDGRMRYVI